MDYIQQSEFSCIRIDVKSFTEITKIEDRDFNPMLDSFMPYVLYAVH